MGFIVGFCIYRKGSIKYLKKIEKNVLKKTRGTCSILIYTNKKPYKETIGCFGVELTKESMICLVSDPEKLEVVKDEMAREEYQKKMGSIPPHMQQMINHNYQQGIPTNVVVMNKNQVVDTHNFAPQYPAPNPQMANQPFTLNQMANQPFPQNQMAYGNPIINPNTQANPSPSPNQPIMNVEEYSLNKKYQFPDKEEINPYNQKNIYDSDINKKI